MGRLYDACSFILSMENVDLDWVSSNTIYFIKNGVVRITATVSVDPNTEIVRVTPNSPLEEHIEYKMVFSDKLHFENGNKFSKSFCIRFRVKDGATYSPNVIDGDSNYYSLQNRLRFTQLLCIYFDDSVEAPEDLSIEMSEIPESNDVKPTNRVPIQWGKDGCLPWLILAVAVYYLLKELFNF